ncbi:MAG: tRNA uridine-5-carboxymethylaminomethyl(34) synthesis GTPase MnmE [Gammaproteobacteria bacterium]|nr:tRNA uridine-5-carboxymethylaminomethyl(34) synthesis GTPase MnmE [Gammaproteobacteria bacterium]MYF29787.1 tRNA uridine-5-carboxymethylaminomethyl(34) synthesis GTPase MnmE [Gammaproteobacteria bacterium]MYK47735.1 tRNA uridine-5-carboxymethylaminomethyl(34) synthesis GTPase MnmE [Gammaproteobacteria bacterium]
MLAREMIAAIATPPGRGGIGIVRISGTGLEAMLRGLVGRVPAPRMAELSDFCDADGTAIDRGIVIYFPSPRSMTGEDVVELQGHGGPVVMDALLERACQLGARIARPGEFTERAFLNDKIDLAQAEAVADLIDSASTRAARAAMRSLDGEFSARVTEIDRAVLDLRVFLEAAIDFAEEEIDFLADSDAVERIRAVEGRIERLAIESRRGEALREGLDVVIAGQPNAGKSSLLNRLLAENRAIVTDVPGTTRDLLRADIEIEGVPIRLTDTAGLRAGGGRVETIGVERARTAIAQADLVLAVEDATAVAPGGTTASESLGDVAASRIRVRNKVDLTGEKPGDGGGVIRISALKGDGVDVLRAVIAKIAGVAPGEGAYLARKRHLNALRAASDRCAAARERLSEGFGDLAAEELRQVQAHLGDIVGTTTVDDLLGEIFSTFCIGK